MHLIIHVDMYFDANAGTLEADQTASARQLAAFNATMAGKSEAEKKASGNQNQLGRKKLKL
jgi:hypothetical protein